MTELTKWELIDREGYFESNPSNSGCWVNHSTSNKYYIGIVDTWRDLMSCDNQVELITGSSEFKYFKQVALEDVASLEEVSLEETSQTTEVKVGDSVSIDGSTLVQEVVYISKGQVCVEDRDGLLVVNAEEVFPYVEPPMAVLDYISKEGLAKEGSYHYNKIKEMMEG